MFTGIIEDLGKIENLIRSREKLVLTISARFLKELKEGDSISINGMCLTVTELLKKGFKVDAVIETIAVSNINSLKVGDFVNLERAMKMGGRFDGHIVTGHVDTKSIITNILEQGTAREIEISIPDKYKKYIALKGSVTVDGISLTIARTYEKFIIVAIVPHTALHTTLYRKRIGDSVNLEFDVLAKYIETLMQKQGGKDMVVMKDMQINEDFLRQAGFLN